jgi:hypothetical protein
MSKEQKEVEVVLFGIEQKGDLKRKYPELAKIEEFKDLKTKEVRFCWLVGNRTSPIFGMERTKRIQEALRVVWGDRYMERKDIGELADGEIPDHVLKGIYKMNTFDPEYRLKAKLMDEYIFDTLNDLIALDPVTRNGMDIDDKKKYAELAIKVGSSLQDMVERLEGAYGVKTVERKTKKRVLVSVNQIVR